MKSRPYDYYVNNLFTTLLFMMILTVISGFNDLSPNLIFDSDVIKPFNPLILSLHFPGWNNPFTIWATNLFSIGRFFAFTLTLAFIIKTFYCLDSLCYPSKISHLCPLTLWLLLTLSIYLIGLYCYLKSFLPLMLLLCMQT